MLTFDLVVFGALAYVAFLFLVAFAAERRGGTGWLVSAPVYTLSLSIYCTAWTFYGAVGYAARSGLEFLTIYLGPSLIMVGWWWVLRKLVRVGRMQRITSIADLISSRFGKSPGLAALVTLIAVAGVTPYIALQLQSISLSFAAFIPEPAAPGGGDLATGPIALWSAAGLALFTILFGTRSLDANERHHGVVIAIAVEAVVKLVGLLAVGIFVVWGLGGGPSAMLARIDASPIGAWEPEPTRWALLTFLSGAAFLTLPRMFQVIVVENARERHLATASWAFPLYVLLMSLFVVPIAVMGLELMPPGSNPDLFVLTLPLSQGQAGLTMLSFLGGFSSATSMVIVATLALATMVSNHVVLPLWLRGTGPGGPWSTGRSGPRGAQIAGDLRQVVLTARRLSIAGVLALGYLYFRLSGGGAALSSIGLIAFAGVAQILPAMLGGLFWRGATRAGAGAGLALGFALWLWTLFLPSFGPDAVIPAAVLAEGPWGLGWLRPQALFGTGGLDPLLHSVIWSLVLNAAAFALVSLFTFPAPLERLQGAQFVNVFDHSPAEQPHRARGTAEAEAEDLLVMAQRLIGGAEAQALFAAEARAQGKPGWLPEVTPAFLARLERELAGSVGAAAAHAMVGQVAEGASVTVDDLLAMAGEAQQIKEYSARLEAKSAEQERTARQLAQANAKLLDLAAQKDAFLSQISHELRTPMTSIRAFSEILRDGGLGPAELARYSGIIEAESRRLTRLLDDLLDLSVLESGKVQLARAEGPLSEVIERAVIAAGLRDSPVRLVRDAGAEAALWLQTDLDRLAQVFINLLANARKYCAAAEPVVTIRAARDGAGRLVVEVADNGAGIPPGQAEAIFEKFARLEGAGGAPGAGLGLAICREIMTRLGGSIACLPGPGGAVFRLVLPVSALVAPAARAVGG